MSQALSSIRQEVSRRTQDFLQGTATGGGTTSLTDVNGLNYVDDYWTEAWVLFTSGTNNGLIRKVQSFTGSTQTATLYSAVTAAVASGNTYELYRRYSPTDVKNAINIAIGKSWPDFFSTIKDAVVTATFNTFQYAVPSAYALPSDDAFIGIEYQILTDPVVAPTYPYQLLSPRKYEFVRGWDNVNNNEKYTLQLKFNPQTGRQIRFLFEAPLQEVVNDTDIVRLDKPQLEWLYVAAEVELWRMETLRRDIEARQDAKDALTVAIQNEKEARLRLRMKHEQKPLRRTIFDVYTSWEPFR